ncbi:hypothetical protein M0802_001512 [Mischocyttarus mexicanus]|nr:hypothetical protein M0802_001512 [Mischocyttarus mexicanus]
MGSSNSSSSSSSSSCGGGNSGDGSGNSGGGSSCRPRTGLPRQQEAYCIQNESETIDLFGSPTSTALGSLDQLKEYLTTPGTCKCGLDCPFRAEQVFNFDPKMSGLLEADIDLGLESAAAAFDLSTVLQPLHLPLSPPPLAAAAAAHHYYHKQQW